MKIEGFKIISLNESSEKNSKRFELFSEQVKNIKTRTEEVKEKYGVKDTEMSSFSPDLLSTSEHPMILSQEVFNDYQRILQQTNSDGKEHNFLWLGKKQIINGQESYVIEKVIVVSESVGDLRQSEAQTMPKINIYDDVSQHNDYDIVIDGHSHPVQDSDYKDFNKLPSALLNELSLCKPGENFSIDDLYYYNTLLSIGIGKNVKDKTIIGAVVTYTGKLLTVVLDKDDNTILPNTIRQISIDIQNDKSVLPTSEFDKEKSENFFG